AVQLEALDPLRHLVRRRPALLLRLLEHFLANLLLDLGLHRLGDVDHPLRLFRSGLLLGFGGGEEDGEHEQVHCAPRLAVSRAIIGIGMSAGGGSLSRTPTTDWIASSSCASPVEWISWMRLMRPSGSAHTRSSTRAEAVLSSRFLRNALSISP